MARSSSANGITNRLYLGGYPAYWEGATSEGGQLIRGNGYLANGLGPLYFQADTAWAAPVRARFDAASNPNCAQASGWSTNDWKCYLADRVAKGFTAVSISVPQWWMPSQGPLTDTAGQAPFVNSTAFPQWSKWNPAFWQGFDAKVQHANEMGLLVVVVGLMEPSYQYLAQDSISATQRYPPQEDARTFARNLTARLAGNFVILSPGFDTRPDGGARSALIRSVGAEIHAVRPWMHVTNHFGGSTPVAVTMPGVLYDDYRDFQGSPWLDLHLFQSGQCMNLPGGGAATPAEQLQNFTNRARQMPLDLRALSPRKPLGNGEAIYDRIDAVLEAGQSGPANAHLYRPYRVRHTAWLSTLSGAFGATLGVYGLWDWGRGDGPAASGGGPYQPRSPQTTVQNQTLRISAEQMQHLGNLFRSHRWEWLAPVPALIRNNPAPTGNQHLQSVASRHLTRRTTLAYLPDNEQIYLQLSPTLYPGLTTARWSKQFWNPRDIRDTAKLAVPSLVPGTTDVYSFTRPICPTGQNCVPQNGDRDWVLILRDTSLGASAWSQGGTDRFLQVWEKVDPDLNQWSLRGQLFEASGESVSEEVEVAPATPSLQRQPQVARGSDGSFLVVWEAEEPSGEASVVLVRRVSKEGVPLGEPFKVHDETPRRRFEPVVTADAAGRFVVTWASEDPENERVDVWLQRFDLTGAPVGEEIWVSSIAAANRRAPLVSTDPLGSFVVAWQEYAQSSGVWSLRARRFQANGEARGGEQLIAEGGSEEYLALERLETDALGSFQVIWQQLAIGESQGHWAVAFDGITESLGSPTLVTEPGL